MQNSFHVRSLLGSIVALAAVLSAGLASAEEITIASLSLRMTVPTGAVVKNMVQDGSVVVDVFDGRTPPRWSARIQEIRREGGVLTPVAELRTLLDSLSSTTPGIRTLAEGGQAIADRPGRILMVEDPGNERRSPSVQAWACVGLDGGANLLVSLRGRSRGDAQPVLDTIVRSITIGRADLIETDRAIRLEAGRNVLDQVSEGVLRGITGQSQWYRTFRRENGREIEVGCMLVETLEAPRGAVNPQRDPARFTSMEREMGFMVRVLAQFPISDGLLRNSVAMHWLAWDDSSETWSVVATTTDGRRDSSAALTGVRASTAGDPRGKITAVESRTDAASPPPVMWTTPKVYLSQPLRWILPDLFVNLKTTPGTYAWYSVDAAGGVELKFRTDQWSPSGSGFELISQPDPAGSSIRSTHDRQGRLVRRETADGTTTVPIELAELHRLWKSKGLPVGGLDRPRPGRERRR
ncbi:MAG: hypothetical protein AB8G96_05585 [Phycisphaerales bacterium]